MKLSIHRLHPDGCRIEAADKHLQNTAHLGGVKWCGPYSTANRLGWWLYSPVDLDVLWKGGELFEYKQYTPYSDYDYHFVRQLVRPEDGVDPDKWCMPGGRTKTTWGVADVGVVQVWTGCIFKTPPGWGLHVRSPINFAPQPYHIQEGVLETDWMQYDVWMNVKFHTKGRWTSLRREGPPLAQLVPIRREAYDQAWETEDVMLTRDTEEGEKVTSFWLQYNRKKYENGGKQRLSLDDPTLTKDSTTYFRERKEALKCPYGR